jgi:alkaline phosphatase D
MKNLRRTTAAALLLLFAAGMASAAEFPHFTHGPILGRLSEHGIGVWARTGEPGEFRVRYGESANALTQNSDVVKTKLENDNTGWVHITGLKANTKYYYELEIPGAETSTHRRGSFRTLPDSRDFVDEKLNADGLFNFSFEYACGNNQNPGQSVGPSTPTFKTMMRRISGDINFAILNGDWLYETRRSYKVSQWLSQVDRTAKDTPQPVQVAPALVGVWQNYKHFLEQSRSLNEWHRVTPTFFTYDDHEILNDVWGAGSPGLRDRRAVFRDVGVKAWYDYLGWSNPTTFPQRIRFGRAKMKAGSFVLTDEVADFRKLDLSQVNNLHVHWGSKTDGVNENELDGVGGVANAGVYAIESVLGAHQLKLSHAA